MGNKHRNTTWKMKKNTIFAIATIAICTGCASFSPEQTEFSSLLTGFFFFVIFMISTPRVFSIISIITGNEDLKSAEEDMIHLDAGAARREDLDSFQMANAALISGVCIPAIIWFLILLGINGGNANIIGGIVGLIVSVFLGNRIFLFSKELRPYANILKTIMLIVAIYFLFM